MINDHKLNNNMTNGTERKRVLLLTSKTGGGHISLAESLRDRLEAEYECTISDPQPSMIHVHYRLVSRYALWLWQAEYRFGDNPKRAISAHRLFASVLYKPMLRLLASVQPHLIVSTYAMYTAAMHNAIRTSGRSIATALLLSDPQEVHATWLAIKDVDCVLAPTRETESQALAAGFPLAQVRLSGWPVRRQFTMQNNHSEERLALPSGVEVGLLPWNAERDAALQALGLESGRFTVFLQGGGEGSARFARTVEAGLGAQNAVQVILATGTNELLRARFAQTPRVYALPFTKEIAHYMALSDVIMGKAGPNMLFESVTLGKPFIATTYIPGQETPNLEFIRRHNLGWVALEANHQASLIQTLAQDPTQMTAQNGAVAAYRSWNLARLEMLLPQCQALIDRYRAIPGS